MSKNERQGPRKPATKFMHLRKKMEKAKATGKAAKKPAAVFWPVMKRVMQDQASYICDACGEEIVIPLDLSAGASQEYVEDCPVCCRSNLIHVEFDDNGNATVWAEPEQDYE